MDTKILQRHFADCSLAVTFVDQDPRSRWQIPRPKPFTEAEQFYFVDVVTQQRRMQHFRIYAADKAELHVMDKNPARRHLLLHVRCLPVGANAEVSRHLLMGHDERQLFVVPSSGVSNVRDALAALKPAAVRRAEQQGLKVIRQGDWFFIPVRGTVPINSNTIILRNEQIGGSSAWRWGIRVGHPHVAEEQIFTYGTRYVRQGKQWVAQGEELKSILVRGKIRHEEHSTVELRTWYSAIQNTQAAAQMTPSIGYFD